MVRLLPHPSSPARAVRAVEASVRRDPDGLTIAYRVTGALDRIRWPAPSAAPGPRDGLWQTTVFEAFFAGEGDGYREYNFAPSGDFAAYRFDDYRSGMAAAATDVRIENERAGDLFVLTATIIGEPADRAFGLTAIIEEVDGTKSYWSCAHPDGPPDFHHKACLVLAAADIAEA